MMNTVAQGLYVLEACRLRDAGVPLQEAVKRLGEITPSGRIFFTIGSIDYLSHGGRIGKLAGKVSSVLGIRPIISSRRARSSPPGVCRGRGKSLDKVLSIAEDYMKETFAGPDEFEIALGYGYDATKPSPPQPAWPGCWTAWACTRTTSPSATSAA